MKIKRYLTQDFRSAVQAVKDELGSNAVIISHHHVFNGVEVTAAVDDEFQYEPDTQPLLVNNTSSELSSSINYLSLSNQYSAPVKKAQYFNCDKQSTGNNNISCKVSNGNESCTKNKKRDNKSGKELHGSVRQHKGKYPAPCLSSDSLIANQLITDGFTENDSMNNAVLSSKQKEKNRDYAQSRFGKEFDSEKLNLLIEQQVTEHAWGDIARKNPVRAQLIRQLLKLDIHPLLIQKITNSITSENIAAKSVFPHALALIANKLPIYKEDVTACGGTVALFGATGVGKTTTIAKMAARFALKNGRDKVGLVTTDSNRLGAKEQLGLYSKILGIPLKVVRDDIDLLDALNAFSDKAFVLIDTAGMGPREISSSKYLELFSGAITQITNFLVLPATAHRAVLEKNASAFQSIKLDGSIITRLDETASLGGPLSVSILNNLPLAYYSNGQKIPDDFHLARAHNLVSHAVSVAGQHLDSQAVDVDFQDKSGIEAHVSI
ncbi:flagellar biosynthesis protein FlhF [Kaarinaea lacus]